MSWAKLSYLLRTTNLHNYDWRQFDNGIRDYLSDMLGCTLTDTAWCQATLPIKLGGLGLLSPARVAKPAFIGSLFFTADLLEQNGIDPNCEPLP